MALGATVAAAVLFGLGWLAVVSLDEAPAETVSPSPERLPSATGALPDWWSPLPGATVETPVLYDDGQARTGTVVLRTDAGPAEVMDFYRGRLLAAGFAVDDIAMRPGVAAVLRAGREDGGSVTITAFPDSAVVRFDELASDRGGSVRETVVPPP